MNCKNKISESMELGIVLAIAGGFMDAYSYMCRDHVFANAQTGNILLLGINISEGNWGLAFRYVCPILAFVLGIVISNYIRTKVKDHNQLHWRQIAVFCEAIVLVIVCFIPQSLNGLANSLTSLACGIQVESFRIINGNGAATTMCIGNLRSATYHLFEYWNTKDKESRNKESRNKGLFYFTIISFFIIGAVLGNICVEIFMEKAILVCAGILSIAFAMMFINKD